jgi:[NiFe] hydrogenase assembly HybE family chaperone
MNAPLADPRVQPADPGGPVARLQSVFRTIGATRMQGLPFVNERLAVEAVGFRRWEGRWLGVLITPWFMNLVLLPDDPRRWHSAPVRATRSYALPAGVFDFIAGYEEGVGEFQSCSLFSPMFEFSDQEVARATALAALAALFDRAARAGVEGPRDGPAPQPGAPAPPQVEPGAAPVEAARHPDGAVSKRDFLRGRWSAGPIR